MATIINNPARGETTESNSSLALVVVVLLIAGLLLFMFGLPDRQANDGANITVPESIDVNVSGGAGGAEGGAGAQ